MRPDFSPMVPFLLAGLVVFAVYRRLRRSFGRQPLRPRRMTARIVLLSVIACALLPAAVRSPQFLAAELLGAASGVALALWGAAQTRFVMADAKLHYVPHTYTGIVVSLLFLGRLVFRLVQAYAAAHAPHATHAGGAPDPSRAFAPASMAASSLTAGIFFVLAGYYLYYYSWVLWKSKHLAAADIEGDSVAAH
jgi:hypothetical protein